MVDTPLLVQSRDRLRADHFTTPRDYSANWYVRINDAERIFNKVATHVRFYYDPIGRVEFIRANRFLRPGGGRIFPGQVVEHISMVASIDSANQNAGFVTILTNTYRRVYSNDNALADGWKVLWQACVLDKVPTP